MATQIVRKTTLAGISFALSLSALAPRASAEDAVAPALAAPPLALSVSPVAGSTSWKLRIENTGEVPVRIAADPRLLVLEVTPPAGTILDAPTTAAARRAAAKKASELTTVRCALPGDARPATDDGRDLVVPSSRSWSADIDPLLYCLGARERRALVAGASVKPIYGWPAPAPRTTATAPRNKTGAPAPPFVAAPVGAALGKVASAKSLEGAPFTLAEAVPGAMPPAAPAPVDSSPSAQAVDRPSLVVSMPETLDVARGNEITTTVTVTNEGDKAAILLFRPETLRFSVEGPAGSVACGMTRVIDSPIRELYSTIGRKARASVSLLLTAACPADTFDDPGLYRVTAILDTTGASARSLGLKTWDGEATAKHPMLLRVRSPRRAEAGAAPRPSLD